jgi:hypothetical protein
MKALLLGEILSQGIAENSTGAAMHQRQQCIPQGVGHNLTQRHLQ